MKKHINEIRRMQQLAGILKEAMYVGPQGELQDTGMTNPDTLLRNQRYIEREVPIENRKEFNNLGKNTTVNKPYTVEKIVQAVKPIVAKEAWYDPNADPNLGFEATPDQLESVLKEFSGWLKENIEKYNFILNQDKLTARELYEQIYYDYVFDVNELDVNEPLNMRLKLDNPDPLDDPLTRGILHIKDIDPDILRQQYGEDEDDDEDDDYFGRLLKDL